MTENSVPHADRPEDEGTSVGEETDRAAPTSTTARSKRICRVGPQVSGMERPTRCYD
jgi:hypothetical protein